MTRNHDICQSVTSGCLSSPSGYLTSPNYPLRYEPGHDCHVTISVSTGHFIHIYLLDMNLAHYTDHNGCIDALMVSESGHWSHDVCVGSGLVYRSVTNSVTVHFRSTDAGLLTVAKGFWLYYKGRLWTPK